MRTTWLVVLCVLLLVPTSAAVPYLQFGVDAARTGVTTDPGPEHMDLAFEAQLPGRPAYLSVPLIIGDAVFVLMEGAGVHGLYRVDLATTEVTQVVSYDRAPSSLASDGELLFVAGPDGIEAYPVPGGERVWTWDYPMVLEGPTELPVPRDRLRTVCAPLALDHGSLFAACSQGVQAAGQDLNEPGDLVYQPADPAPSAFVVRLDGVTGRESWLWPWQTENCTADLCRDRQEQPVITSLALHDELVVAGGIETSLFSQQETALGGEFSENPTIAAVDREHGSHQWDVRPSNFGTVVFNVPAPGIAATEATIYVTTGVELHAYDAEDGSSRWSQGFVSQDIGRLAPQETFYFGGGLAVDSERAFASGANEVLAFDLDAGQGTLAWRRSLPTNGLDAMLGMIRWGENIMGASYSGDLFVLSADAGETRYLDGLGASAGVRYGVGDGIVVAVPALGGEASVFGYTPASITSLPVISAEYPRLGESLTIDLSSSRPGVFGPPNQFRIEWGDGGADDWQSSARFEHAYSVAGTVQGRAYARNDAGQVASIPFTVHVGGSKPNVISEAFAPGNQDLTFGVLGILLAFGGGTLAVAKTRSRRRRVNKELAAIQEAYDSTKDRPRDCEAALAERRAHVHGLGLDGRIDQPAVLLLERHIDELARQHRLGTLDARFHFLPYGLVMSLKEMLADGLISVWEREHLLRAIDADRAMTAAQKRKVRDLVDEWADRDEGVRA